MTSLIVCLNPACFVTIRLHSFSEGSYPRHRAGGLHVFIPDIHWARFSGMGKKHQVVYIVLATLIHRLYGDLLIKGQKKVIMEDDSTRLECVYSNKAYDISKVQFEVFSEWLQIWRPVTPSSWSLYSLEAEQAADKMVLKIPRAASFSERLFRCVSSDETLRGSNRSSETLSFKVHYLREPQLFRVGLSRLFSLQHQIKVRRGDDVALKCYARSSEQPTYYWFREGDDWLLPSPLLSLRGVRASDAGVYACKAEHPSVPHRRSHNVTVVVLPEDARWYESNTDHVVLMALLVALVVVSAPILILTEHYCRRYKKAKVNKGPIDDHSQISPMYEMACLQQNSEENSLLNQNV
ncbi:uncharacterized protein si:ch211-79k12.1 [Nerophis ophidion]|uniref:uncharacterized protein si:ch211-79k12.1 n=1 Tax=Nerophis ophidion TaxID=159077 RepID=UPI002ADF5472|nr:uncharacterized protein si:ch211-79k12.1 [Nerophis ophidion]